MQLAEQEDSKQKDYGLGCVWGLGPQLFLDGEQYMNLQRTDWCVAWRISLVPQRKNEHTESRDEQDPVATHWVMYADVELEMSWCEKVVCNGLVLVVIPERKHAQQEQLHRALTPFDTEDLAEPHKNENGELCTSLGLFTTGS